MLWPPLMGMPSAHAAGIKRRERIHVLRIQRVSVIFVTFSPLNKCSNFLRLLIDLRKKNERQRKWILLPVKTLR